MTKTEQQTSDPGQNHTGNSKNGGDFDLDEEVPAPSRRDQQNRFNGAGVSKRSIDPTKVKGSNP